MLRTRRNPTQSAVETQPPTRPPVNRTGHGGYTYRLHADGRIEILSGRGSTFITPESNASAYQAIIAEVGGYPEQTGPTEAGPATYLDGLSDTDVQPSDLVELVDQLEPATTTAREESDRDVHSMGHDQLKAILAAPETYGLGLYAAAHARSRMLEHQAAFDSTGTGTIEGTQTGTKTPGAEAEDCTTFMLESMSAAFAAVGQANLWTKTMREARKNSPNGLKGTEVMKALESQAGWKSIFWAPDGKNPGDGNNEHSYTATMAKRKGEYYGLNVDKNNTVTNYRPTEEVDHPVAKDTSGLEKLKQVPVAVLAARGGSHMGLMINGVVYEVHWDYTAQSRDTVEATPLENWGWMSGAVTGPGTDIDRAFRAP